MDRVEELKTRLKDPDWFTRARAADELAKIGPSGRGAIPALIAALEDVNSRVRGWAAFALGQMQDQAVVPALIRALRDDNDVVRVKAALALGELGPLAKDAIRDLAVLLEDRVAGSAAEAALKLIRGEP